MNNDLISRSELKKTLCEFMKNNIGIYSNEMFHLVDSMPTVEQPQGEWIKKVDDVGFVSHICSECGAEIEVEDCSDDKFCFNCGADMRGGAE